ncbi:hypothetical protein [Chlorogloeopsis sp. ULAP02]|uniref:hypothetical protein n=1 Tax=Chlorogloeopsis sp. ULAP02 TaxID=3107926 RepID=UPI00313518AF
MQRVEKLDSSAKAEATWTKMYIYMTERDRTFYKDTYPFQGLVNSAYDVLGILDRKDNPIHLDWIFPKQLFRLQIRSCKNLPI